jgi:site-specific recombinase XerD
MQSDEAVVSQGPEELGLNSGTTPQAILGPFPLERYNSLVLRFLNRLKVSGRSAHTISAYRNDLNLFGRFLKDTGLDPTLPSSAGGSLTDHWVFFLETHGRHSPASMRRAQMSVRTYLHFLVESKTIVGSPLLISKSPKQPRSDLFCMPADDFRKLTDQLGAMARKGDGKALRDLALVLVLGKAGLKASEAAALAWEDLSLPDSGKGTLVVRSGEKSRIVPMETQTTRALRDLRNRQTQWTESTQVDSDNPKNESPRPRRESVFFGFQNISRKPSQKAIQRHSIKFIIYELCQSFLSIAYNSESLRNHAILCWFKKGYDSERIADLAGYSSLQSLDRFLTPDLTLANFRRNYPSKQHAEKNERSGATQANRKL